MSTSPTTARAGWARGALFGRGFGSLLIAETRLFLRDGGNLFFALIFPSVLIIGVGYLIPGLRESIVEAGPLQGLSAVNFMIPPVLATAVATPALTVLPVTFAQYRERGILKRLSTTPMRPQAMLTAHVIIGVLAFLVAAALALVLGAIAFDLAMPDGPLQVVGSLVLCAGAMFSIGLIIAALAPRANIAQAIGMLLFFPMLFFAGLWTPGPEMPELIAQIASWTPLGAGSQALQSFWFDASDIPVRQLLVMTGYIAVSVPVAARFFRWK